eukprot:SAG31_NODE_1314_length_8851_cov_7.233318_8_plen_421_part_00
MIGIAMTANSISQFCVQTPVGDIIDRTTHKKAVCALCCILVAAMSLSMVEFPSTLPVIATRIVQGFGSAALPPAIAAITLGCVGPRKFARQISYNEVFNHAGMAACSVAAGLASVYFDPAATFIIVAATALLSMVCLPLITGIDHAVARGLASHDDDGDAEGEKPSESSPASEDDSIKTGNAPVGYLDILRDLRILGFCVCCFGFHFGNAAMLPLLGQKLSLGATTGKGKAMLFMAACQVIAQGIMTIVAAVVGRIADSWGRQPIFIVGFAVIPTRGLIVSLISHSDPWLLISTQVFDGLANGIFGVLSVVVAEDLAAGTGRYNMVFGLVSTCVQIGAACSLLFGEYIVEIFNEGQDDDHGYDMAFRFLGFVALIPVLLFTAAVGETAPQLAASEAPEESRAAPAGVSFGAQLCDKLLFR